MKRTVLLFILFLALLLRIYRISDVPAALSLDEVSIGYNAYSLLKTGADEYGTKFPILLRAYDDWRPAFYVYLVIPSIKLFGLTPFGVRLPSVVLGIFTVWLTYHLTKLLFIRSPLSTLYSLLSSLLLAISPWHIYISRLSHEVNLGLTLIVFGTYCFFRAMQNRKNAKWLMVSAVIFALSLNSYQSEKVVTPILVLSLAILFWRQIREMKKMVLFSIVVGIMVALPLVAVNFQPAALIRFRGTSAFSPNQRKITNVRIFLANYFSHFRPSWLFAGALRESHKVPNLGLLYFWEAPLILLGLYVLVRAQFDKKVKLFLILWLLSAPIPAAITTQSPHAMRSFTFLPVWQILAATGFVALWRRQTMYAWGILGLLTVVSLGYFAKQYFEVFPRTQSDSFQYALTQAIPVALERESQYEHIVFSNTNSLYQSYMFFLFYSRYDPKMYQKEGGTYSGGFAEAHKIGKFEFRPIVWEKEQKNGKTLYVGNVTDFPNTTPDVVVSHLDGTSAVAIVGS